MKFENTEVWGFKHALRGMRNPMNSWDKSDSFVGEDGNFIIGDKDLYLAKSLVKAGREHRKFMRQIFVSVDITAPLYWWKEFDTYKVGTTANSTSTMHKLGTTPISMSCFETDDMSDMRLSNSDQTTGQMAEDFIRFLERLRQKFIQTKDISYWKELIRWLPESWLQTRTVTMNYENIYSIANQRIKHKLNEWSGAFYPSKPNFISWVESLPYAEDLIFI